MNIFRSCRRLVHATKWRRAYARFSDARQSAWLFDRAQDGPPAEPWLHTLQLNRVPEPVYVREGFADVRVVRELFEKRAYAPISRWDLPASAKIIDLGANIGLASLFFSSLLANCSILAVEPDAGNAEILERNCRALIDSRRLRLIRAFAAGASGEAGIDRSGESWSYRKVAVGGGKTAITCLTIPMLLEQAGWERIDLLKCDIEGAEAEIFGNCAAWIGRVRHLIVETHSPYLIENLYGDLKKAGATFEILHARQRSNVGLAFVALA